MKNYRKLLIILCLVLIFIFVTIFLVYQSFLSPVSRLENQPLEEIVIEPGMTSREIGVLLDTNDLIKSDKFFLLYLKINNINDLKAGSYKLSGDMSLKEIIKVIQEGNDFNEEEITITFKEGINFRDIARVISENTNNTYDDVLNTLNDQEYLNSLIEDYWFITDEILNSNIYYPLEGYI